MALETGGLDAQIEQRMDAYRGNPQKLQQRYGANKELLDLLALQKLTSEKQAAARDMQMKMQQQPGTIAQQREQQALDLTKQQMSGTLGELTGRTAGTLGQKQKQQQQNMQRMAKMQPRKPAGIAGLPGLAGTGARPPQAQGLAGARMAQAAAQGGPKRMAGGGIVSFAAGEKVSLSEDQKARAKELFGERYDRIMTQLLQMQADSPEAKAITDQLGPKVQSSPFGRAFKDMFTPDAGDAERRRLETEVQQKYGLPAGLVGGFQQQSDAARQYAQDVATTFSMGTSSLSTDQLRALAEAPFSGDLTAEEIAALPPIATTEQPETDLTELPDSTSEQQPPTTGTVTFEPVEQEDFFKDVPTSYDPVAPEAADKSALNTSMSVMLDQSGKTPTRASVDPLQAAPLEAVAAPYTESEQKLANELSERYVADSNEKPLERLDAARASSDEYFNRSGVQALYDQQEKEERALQADTLSPSKLKRLRRLRAFAGAGRGDGGITSAYLDEIDRQTKDRSAGLTTLRGIQDTGVTSDYNIASQGAASGENAALRAENRRAAGVSGLQGILNRSEERALQGQQEENAVRALNFQADNAIEDGNFNAAREAYNRQGSALRKVVQMNIDDVNNQVKTNLSISEDQNSAMRDALEAKLEVAKAKSKARYEQNIALMNSEQELQKILDARVAAVNASVEEILKSDPTVMALRAKQAELAGSENENELRKIKEELERLRRATIEVLASRYDTFANMYADTVTLAERIMQVRAGNTMVSSTRSELNPNEIVDRTRLDYQPSVPNP